MRELRHAAPGVARTAGGGCRGWSRYKDVSVVERETPLKPALGRKGGAGAVVGTGLVGGLGTGR
jgi:hypothetical protein